MRGSIGPGVFEDEAPRSGPRSFTLVETLLVIVVVAVLLAMFAPSLAKVKSGALVTKDLASLRSTSAVLAVYAGDWKDSFPAFADPKATTSIVYYNNGKEHVSVPRYFASFTMWHFALADGYFAGNPRDPSLYPSEQTSRQGFVGGEPFLLSCTVFAEPDYWDLSKRTGRGQLGATAHHQVEYPSSKIILFSAWPVRLRGNDEMAPALNDPRIRMPAARGDGGAAEIAWSSIEPGVTSGDGVDPDYAFHFSARPPGAHTTGGLRGRDLP